MTYSCVLSQDCFASAQIVPRTPTTPGQSVFSPFFNPRLQGRIEAFFISGFDGHLCHLVADPASSTGWTMTEMFGGVSPVEVFAIPTPDDYVSLVWSDASGVQVAYQQSDGVTWQEGEPLLGGAPSCLRVAHPANAPETLAPRLYAVSSREELPEAVRQLFIWDHDGTSWVSHDCELFLANQTPNENGLLCALGTNYFSFFQDAPAAIFYGALATLPGKSTGVSLANVQRSAQLIGSSDSAVTQGRSTFLSVSATGAVVATTVASGGSPTGIVQLTPPGATPVVSACQTIDATTGAATLFCVDDAGGLSVLYQRDSATEWAPPVPFDTGVVAAWTYPGPCPAPVLFTLAADGSGLQLHLQDASSGAWMVRPVMQSPQTPPQIYDVTRYRTEVTISDQNGAPLAGATVQVSAASTTEVAAGGQCFFVDAGASAILTTNGLGKVTVASLAQDLAPPALTFTCGALTLGPIDPSEAAKAYLGGSATALPQQWCKLDATALQSATCSDGSLLIPASTWGDGVDPGDAATAITSLLGPPGSTTAQTRRPLGFELDRTDPERPALRIFYTGEELQAALGRVPRVESMWSWLDKEANTVWHGVETAVSEAAHVVVDLSHDVASAVVTIVDDIQTVAQMVAQGVEAAIQGVASVFNWLGAKIERVVDWLRALFDFEDIWATKEQLDQVLKALPLWWTTVSASWSDDLQTLFGTLQTDVDGWFEKLGGQTRTVGALQPYQSFGGQPSPTPVTGNFSPADVGGNVHANWFHDQLSSNPPAIGSVPAGTPPGDAAITALQNAEKQIEQAAETLVKVLFPNNAASDLQDTSLGGLVTAFKDLADAGVDVADALAQGLLALVGDTVDDLATLAATEIDGPLKTIYAWAADLAGQPQATPPTLGDLVTLGAAVPCTIIYKLANDNAAPFPQQTAAAEDALSTEDVLGIIACLLSGIGTLFTIWGDLAGDDGMGWLEPFNDIMLAINVVLSYPDLYLHPKGLPLAATSGAAVTFALALYLAWWIAKSSQKPDPAWQAVKTCATSIIGMARLVIAFVRRFDGSEPGLAGDADIVGNIGGATDFLNLQVIKDIPTIGQVVPWVKAAIDGGSGIGGTVLGIMAIESSDAALAP